MSERVVAFYSTPPFWAVGPPPENGAHAHEQYYSRMAEVVFDHRGDLLHLRVCRDGMFMLRVLELENSLPRGPSAPDYSPDDLVRRSTWWGRYLDHLNCFYLLVESSATEAMHSRFLSLAEITRRDVIRMSLRDGELMSSSIPTESVASAYQAARWLRPDPGISILHDPRVPQRGTVPCQVFERTVQQYATAAVTPSLVQYCAALTRALSQYKIGNYETALVLAWFVIEACLNTLWTQFLDDNGGVLETGEERMNRDRRRTLTGRDYPVSVVLQFLELNSRLPYPAFTSIDRVRRYRNKIVHRDGTFDCGPSHCMEALRAAAGLATSNTTVSIRLNLSYSVMGA